MRSNTHRVQINKATKPMRKANSNSLGLDCADDRGAIAKAKFIATQIAIDTPELNHRHVAGLNDAGNEIFEAPIRSKPPVC